MLSDTDKTLLPLRLATTPGERRARRLAAASASAAGCVVLAGSTPPDLAARLVAHLLRLSDRGVALGTAEAVALGPTLTESGRISIAIAPEDAAYLDPGPAYLGIVSLRADECPGPVPADWTRPLAGLAGRVQKAVVANAEDPVALGTAVLARSNVHATGGIDPSPVVARRGNQLVVRDPDSGARLVLPLACAPVLTGPRLPETMVAIAVALLAGARAAVLEAGLQSFDPGPMCFEQVSVRRGVRFINDGSATTPGLAAASVAAAGRRSLVVAGGEYMQQPLDRWTAAVAGARYLLLFGPAAPLLSAHARNRTTVVRCADFEDAIMTASRLARSGDTVLYSPACAADDSSEVGGPGSRLAYLLGLDRGVEAA